MNKDFGYFGKGLEGYVQYKTAFDGIYGTNENVQHEKERKAFDEKFSKGVPVYFWLYDLFVFGLCGGFFLMLIFSVFSQFNLFFNERFNYYEFLWGLIAIPSFVVGILIKKNKDEEKLEKIKILKEIKQECGYFKNDKNGKRFDKIVNTYETLDKKVLVKRNFKRLLMSVFVSLETTFMMCVTAGAIDDKLCAVFSAIPAIFYAGYGGKIFAWNNVDFEYYCFYTALCELEEQLHIPVMNICRVIEAEKKSNVFGCIPNDQWEKAEDESPYGEEVLSKSCENYEFVSRFFPKYGFNIQQKNGHYYILVVGEYRYYVYYANENKYDFYTGNKRTDSGVIYRHHMKDDEYIFENYK